MTPSRISGNMNRMATPAGGPRLTRRQLLGQAVLVSTVAGLTACTSGKAANPSSASRGNTKLGSGAGSVTFLGADAKKSWQPFLHAFDKAYPDIDLNYQFVPFASFQSTVIQRLSSGGSSIDVLYVDPPAIPMFVQRGFLADLTDTFQSEVEDDILSSAATGAVYQDKLWTVPMWTSSQVLIYNKTLLDAAGIKPPGQDPDERMTWEQIAENGKVAQEKAGAKWGFVFGQPIQYYQLQPLPESLDGGPGVTGDCGLTVDLTNDGWLHAGQWYHDVHEQGIVPRGLDIGQTGQAFLNGEAAYYVDATVGQLPTIKNFEWGLSYFPRFDAGHAVTPTDSWHLGISAHSKNVDAAEEVLAYAGLDTQGALKSVEAIPLPPTNRKAFAKWTDTMEGLAPQLDGFSDILDYELANTAVHRPFSLGYAALEERVTQAWADVRAGADPRQAFGKAQDDLSHQFSRLSCK